MLSDHVCNIVMSSIAETKESLFPVLQINLSVVQTKKNNLDLKKQRNGKSNNVV